MIKAGFTMALVLAFAAPVSALTVCPDGEPKFVYNDVGNDGCFDDGVDSEIPAATYLGTYSAPAGTSIVVPKGVKVVGGSAVNLVWHAVNIFVRGKVTALDAYVQLGASNRYEIAGKLSGEGTSADVVIACDSTCAAGSVIASKSSLTSTGAVIISGGFDIEGGVKIVADENVVLSNVRSIGAKTSIVGLIGVSAGLISPASIGDKTKTKAPAGSVALFSTGDGLDIGDGASIEGISINLGGSHDVTMGEGVRLRCSTSSCAISNNLARTIGNGLKISSGGAIAVTGGGNTTIGAGAKLTGASVSISQGGLMNLGESAKLTAEAGTVQISATGAATIGTGSKLTGNSVSISGGGTTIEDGVKLSAEAGTVTVSTNGVTLIGEGVTLDGTSNVTVSGAGAITIGTKAKISSSTSLVSIVGNGSLTLGDKADIEGVGASISTSDSRTIGEGVSIAAGTGFLSVTGLNNTTIGAGIKLSGEAVSVSQSGALDFGIGGSATAGAGGLSVSGAQTIDIRSGVTFSSAGNLSMSSSGNRSIEDGVTLSAAGYVTLSTAAVALAGNDLTIAGTTVDVSSNGALTFGNGLAIESSADDVYLSSANPITIGDKLSIASATSITFSSSQPVTIGEKAKGTAGSNISFSSGSAFTLGAKGKWTSDATINGMAPTAFNVGAGIKMSAGFNVSLITSSANGTLQFGEKVKLRSGTLEDPMLPASMITLTGATISATKLALSAADDANTIAIQARTSLSVSESKMGAKTITVGTTNGPAFTIFEFTYDKVKGTDETSTLTFQAGGATCDLTGSKFTNLTVDTTTCGTVVGP